MNVLRWAHIIILIQYGTIKCVRKQTSKSQFEAYRRRK